MFVCAFCGRELPMGDCAPKAQSGGAKASFGSSSPGDQDVLDGLLGDSADECDSGLSLEKGESRFCRTCAHSLFNLYQNRCLLHHKNVEPMQICKDYKKR